MKIEDARLAFIALQAYRMLKADPEHPLGGAEAQLFQLADALGERYGCRTRFICLGETDGVERHGPHEVATVSRARDSLGKARGVLEALADYGADVTLQRSWGLETWLGARHARRHGGRLVFMTACREDVAPFPWRDWLRWRRVLYRAGFRRADRVVAQSRDQVEDLRRNWRVDATLIRSVQPPPEPRREDKRGLLWVGRAVAIKRPGRFLDLAERLPDLPFTFVMNPTHEVDYTRRLTERAERLPNVRHIPYVPYERIMEAFHAARMVVGTSVAEGFPNVYLQAFRARTPVMSLNVDPDGIIRERRLGFMAHDDLDALAREIDRRYDDDEWLAESGDRAARYLTENHDRDVVTRQWGELLAGTLADVER